MIHAWWWIVLSTLPCEPPAPLPQGNPQISRAYTEVGEAQIRAGAWGAARIAFEQALAWAPGNGEAARGLGETCRQLSNETSLDRALAQMDAGRFDEALSLLSQLPPSPSVHLLRGICELQSGFDSEAAASLEQARQSPELAPEADGLLSLVYLANGDARAAEQSLSSMSGTSAAQQLLKLAAREGRLVLRAEVGSGLDTNPALDSADPGASAPTGSSAAQAVSASALLRSGGKVSPFLQISASTRWLPQALNMDSTMARAGAGVTLSQTRVRADVDYAWDGMTLGGSPYLAAHQLRGRGMLLWSKVYVAADYLGRLESYFGPPEQQEFSGIAQGGGLSLGFSPSAHLTFEAGYRLAREQAKVEELSYTEHGPSAFILLSGQDVRLQLSAGLLLRSYDAFDPDFNRLREDVRTQAQARGEWDLGRTWTAFASIDAFRMRSNVLPSSQVVAQLGMAFTLGLL
jgi:Flp pilus assembly protein TadD